MKILIWGRGMGKTTAAIDTLRKTKDACMFVFNSNMMKNIPKDVRDRVFPYKSRAWIGQPFKKAIIDEADFMEEDKLKEIELLLDIILVTSSIGKSYDDPTTWLRQQIKKYGYDHKPRLGYAGYYLKEQFEKEFLAKFKEEKEEVFDPSKR